MKKMFCRLSIAVIVCVFPMIQPDTNGQPKKLGVNISVKAAAPAGHPYLFTAERINGLAAGGDEWIALKSNCDDDLNTFINFGYAGWDLRNTAENYALAYLVSKQTGANADAAKYGQKGLALAKVLSRHFGGYSSEYFEGYQFIGLGDGITTSFTLPMTPMPGAAITVMRAPVTEVAITYSSDRAQIMVGGNAVFVPILKVSNTAGGPPDYSATDYRMEYRDPETNEIWVMRWITSNQPAAASTYYVSVPTAVDPTTEFSIQGNAVVFAIAPTTGEAVFIRFLADNYEQTGNFLGGINTAQPDGPGYANRTFSTGLAEAYDAFYDMAEFTAELKQEFYTVQNGRLDWYKNFGYERNGDIGNYFIESFLQPVFMTAYGTQPENPRAAEWQAYTITIAQNTLNALANDLPSGFYVQGDYSVQTSIDILHTFSLLEYAGGPDYLTGLSWTDNLIPAIIHGTKPDRMTFHDNADWTTLPAAAAPFAGTVREFIRDLPDHPTVPYARQWLQDIGETPPLGPLTDYKLIFAPSFKGQVSGPAFARTNWGIQAVWLSLSSAPYIADHQHRDQGHFTVQCGADYLIQDGGGYGNGTTLTWHNTMGFDDGGAFSTYPPGQGYWGADVRIDKFKDNEDWVYIQTNYADAYRRAYSESDANSVKKAVRSLLFLRSQGLIVLHDQVKLADSDIQQIFNLNFLNAPVQNGSLYTETVGSSKLFMQAVIVPSGSVTTLTPVTSDHPVTSMNYQVTVSGFLENTFLHVFQAAPSSINSMIAFGTMASQNGAAQGIEVGDGPKQRVILFAIKDNPYIPDTVVYSPSTIGNHEDILTDLRPDFKYDVTIRTSGGSVLFSDTLITADQGTLIVAYANSETVTVTAVPSAPNTYIQTHILNTPSEFSLSQNYPNPFNPATKITFTVGTHCCVSVKIFDILGREIVTLINGMQTAGEHTVIWNGKNSAGQAVGSGTYFYQLKTDGGFIKTRKMILLK